MFDGAKAFGVMFVVGIGGVIVAWPLVGFWGLVPVGFGLYYLLCMTNRYEGRSLRDDKAKKSSPRRSRKKS